MQWFSKLIIALIAIDHMIRAMHDDVGHVFQRKLKLALIHVDSLSLEVIFLGNLHIGYIYGI